MGSLFTSVSTAIGFLADAVKYGPMLLTFIQSTVSAVEATGQTGEQKLTAVLNAVEVFAENLLPNEKADIEAFMKAVEDLINDLVGVYNAAGVFLHKPS